MKEIDSILSNFSPITLQEMDSVKLLDRVDKKYMFTISQLPAVLAEMRDDYYVLQVEANRYTNYETLYFDSPDFNLFLKHHNGKLNRYKFRSRRYVENDLHFFEVKFKNNKGRTLKNRILNTEHIREIEDPTVEFVKNTTGMSVSGYDAKLWVHFRRMTFVSKKSKERMTIDTDITFRTEKDEVKYDRLVIAEVKQESAQSMSAFVHLMKNFRVKEKSLSKYCLGVISLFPSVKNNNFKPVFLNLKKILANERNVLQS